MRVADDGEYSLLVYARPEAWYVRSTSQDVRGTWWRNDFVERIDLPVDLQALVSAVNRACQATRRDLPPVSSWGDSPSDPGGEALLKAAGVKSVTAFLRPARAVVVEMGPTWMTANATSARGTTHVGDAATLASFPRQGFEQLLEYLQNAFAR